MNYERKYLKFCTLTIQAKNNDKVSNRVKNKIKGGTNYYFGICEFILLEQGLDNPDEKPNLHFARG